jgi:hypothetical protein
MPSIGPIIETRVSEHSQQEAGRLTPAPVKAPLTEVAPDATIARSTPLAPSGMDTEALLRNPDRRRPSEHYSVNGRGQLTKTQDQSKSIGLTQAFEFLTQHLGSDQNPIQGYKRAAQYRNLLADTERTYDETRPSGFVHFLYSIFSKSYQAEQNKMHSAYEALTTQIKQKMGVAQSEDARQKLEEAQQSKARLSPFRKQLAALTDQFGNPKEMPEAQKALNIINNLFERPIRNGDMGWYERSNRIKEELAAFKLSLENKRTDNEYPLALQLVELASRLVEDQSENHVG